VGLTGVQLLLAQGREQLLAAWGLGEARHPCQLRCM